MTEDSANGRNSIILIAMLALNMVAITGFGYFVWQQHQKTLDKSSSTAPSTEKSAEIPLQENVYTRKVVRFESLITNLAGDDGRRVVQLTVEAKCEGDAVLTELESIKPKIRDLIVSVVTSTSADDLASVEGKQKLKDTLKNQMNSMLSKGKVTEVYLTNLQLN